jgi:hypothetical protein
VCSEKWIESQQRYDKTDCGKCNCGTSSASHSSATDPDNGMKYCTKCNEWI